MLLIADSGSTKTTWCLIDRSTSRVNTIQTDGINPFYQDENAIYHTLSDQFGKISEPVDEIHFYGAGCANQKVNDIVGNALKMFFDTENIEVSSDLLAAARALCQHNRGIACILGTGSNSCYYNGNDIELHVSPLGFILGDEGSGAVLGKRLLADVLKNQLPAHIIRLFFEQYKTTRDEILENIYRIPFPNRYAAGFTTFISRHINDTSLEKLVTGEFELFFKRNILQYTDFDKLDIHFAGSIAYHFKKQLHSVMQNMNLRSGKILQAPMDGLIEYHMDKKI